MNRMGGLWRKIPITHWTMLIGAIAIAGIPPLAGFFSKDEILGEAFKLGLLLGLAHRPVVAVHDRVLHVPADGQDVLRRDATSTRTSSRTIHESPLAMTVPLDPARHPVGPPRPRYLGLPLGRSADPAAGWSRSSIAPRSCLHHDARRVRAVRHRRRADPHQRRASAALGLVVGIWLFGFFRSGGRSATASTRITAANGATRFLYRASLNKWWFDDLNDLLFVRIGGRVAAALWWFDVRVIDGTVNGIGDADPGRGRRAAADPDRPRPELRAGHRHRPARHGRLVPRDRGAAAMTLRRPCRSLTLVIFLPLVGALVLAFLPRDRPNAVALGRRWARRSSRGSCRSRLLVGFVTRRRRASSSSSTVDWIPLFGIQYKRRRRRPLARARRAHDDADLDQHPRQLRADQDPGEGVHDLLPRARGRA